MKALLLAPMSSVHERFNTANINALRAWNCEIHLAANFQGNDHDREYRARMEREGIVVHDLPFVRHSLLRNILQIGKVKALLRENDFDLVHCHTETGGILTRLAMGAEKRAKYIYTPHGMSFYQGSSFKSQLIYRPIEKWICKKMDANLAMNREEFENLTAWNAKTANMIHGIGLNVTAIKELTVDREAKRAELAVPADAKLVMSIGELNDNKNHKTVIEALAARGQTDVYYVICGEGEKREELRALSREKGLGERLILTGYRYDVKEILKAADVFAFPSFHEGLPVSVMEAMAAGLPVVCSEIRGNVDLIANGEGGFLCRPDDIAAWKTALGTLLEDAELCRKCREDNLSRVEEFSYDRVLHETETIYRAVLR